MIGELDQTWRLAMDCVMKRRRTPTAIMVLLRDSLLHGHLEPQTARVHRRWWFAAAPVSSTTVSTKTILCKLIASTEWTCCRLRSLSQRTATIHRALPTSSCQMFQVFIRSWISGARRPFPTSPVFLRRSRQFGRSIPTCKFPWCGLSAPRSNDNYRATSRCSSVSTTSGSFTSSARATSMRRYPLRSPN